MGEEDWLPLGQALQQSILFQTAFMSPLVLLLLIGVGVLPWRPVVLCAALYYSYVGATDHFRREGRPWPWYARHSETLIDDKGLVRLPSHDDLPRGTVVKVA